MKRKLNIKYKSFFVLCIIVFSSCANRYKTLGETLPHLIYTDVVTWRYPDYYYYDVPDTTIKLIENIHANPRSVVNKIDSSNIELLKNTFSSNESAYFLQSNELYNLEFNIGDTILLEFGTYDFINDINRASAYFYIYKKGNSYFFKKEKHNFKYSPEIPNPMDTFAWGRFLEKDCYRFNLTTSGSYISSIGYKFIRLSAKEVEVTYCGGKGMNKYKVRL
jgi:hypothetical protein